MYTKQQKRYVVSRRKQGWTWKEIAEDFNHIFGESKTPTHLMDISRKQKWIPDAHLNTREAQGDIIKEYGKADKTFFLTGGIPLNPNLRYRVTAHEGFLRAIETFVKNRKAQPHILLMRPHLKALQHNPAVYDRVLQNYRSWWATQLQLGRYIKAVDLHINPQQINPLTGLQTLGRGNGFLFKDQDRSGDLGAELRGQMRSSIVVAHTKQMLETVPTAFNALPRVIASTGVCNKPQYLSNTVGVKAEDNHVLGGLVVELKGSKFFLRQVQADPITGEFVDLGKRYHPDGRVTEERAEWISVCDAHFGMHRESAFKAILDMIEYFQPLRTFWNDFLTCFSVSPFMGTRQGFDAANLPKRFRSLGLEFSYGRQIKQQIQERLDPIDTEAFMVWSNHHKWVKSYINAGKYTQHPQNRNLCVQLEVLMQLGYDPFQVLLECEPNHYLDIIKNGLDSKWTYFEPGEDYYVDGIHLSNHGHAGIGRRGSIQDAIIAFGKSVVNHFHRPGIYGQTYVNGTLEGKSGYVEDQPLSWIPASTVGYTGGMRQLIFTIDGEFRA